MISRDPSFAPFDPDGACGLLDALVDAIIVVDQSGRIGHVNAAAQQLFGYPASALLGRPVEMLMPAASRERHPELRRRTAFADATRAMGHGRALPALRADGGRIRVEISLSPVRRPDGDWMMCTVVPVGPRVAELESLRLAEERFRESFEEAPIGMALVGIDGRFLRVNSALCDMFGYAAEELAELSFLEITHPDDVDRGREFVQRMVTGETRRWRMQKRCIDKTGAVVWVDVSTSLVRDALGEPLHLISQLQDITLAKAAEEARAEERRMFLESESVGRIGSWTWDLETGARGWSPAQFSLHGADPARGVLSIDEILALVPAARREAAGAGFAECLVSREPFTHEYQVIHPELGMRTLELHGTYLPADPTTGRNARLVGTTRDVTEQRAARAVRDRVEQRQRVLLSSLPDTMIALYSPQLRCTMVHGGLLSRLGIQAGATESAELLQATYPELGETVGEMLERALAGETRSMDVGLDDGLVLHVDAAPYREGSGGVRGAFTVWRDVTERRQREAAAERLATIVKQSEDAIFVKSREGIITAWNGAAERLYGYTAEEMIGEPVAILIPAERAGEDQAILAEALADRPRGAFQTTRVRKDGERVHVSLSVSPLRSEQDVIVGASVIARDITEQTRAEAARRAAEEQLRVTVEHAPIGVALIDLGPARRGRLVTVNAAFTRLLGEPEPISEMSLTALVHPDDAEMVNAELDRLARNSLDRVELEVRALRAEGQIAWLLMTGAAVPSSSGESMRAVIHLLDIEERKKFEGQLQYVADHDPLTGLFNRRRFEEELARTVAHANRYATRGAVLLIDLDGFKYVNDTMGHAFGDLLITQIGRLLAAEMRETDTIARLGGDEFGAILPEADEETAGHVADKILRAFRTDALILSEHRYARVTASIGITTFDPNLDATGEELIVEADIAMYEAKEAGKNCARTYDRSDDGETRLLDRGSWLERLTAAIEEDRFELLAQPIRGIRTDDIDRYELLLRLRTPDGDLIPPSTFLYVAERFDLIQRIDRWVLAQAVDLLRLHHERGHDISLNVNLSGKTLCDPDLTGDINALLTHRPIPADRLVIEVTETAAIVNIERARHVASALRAHGCRFALDDFGAGFASFYYLKHVPFDYLKIDGEFVKTLSSNTTDQLVVKSVVDIAKGLGAQTIAEFVGDDLAVGRLHELGVDYGQGYHLGRPQPIKDILPALVT